MTPVINRPTRITSHSVTAIDHIFVDFSSNFKYETGKIKYYISDHLPIFLVKHMVKPLDIKKTKQSF